MFYSVDPLTETCSILGRGPAFLGGGRGVPRSGSDLAGAESGRRLRGVARAWRGGRRARPLRAAARLGAPPGASGVYLLVLAEGAWRRRADAHRAGDLQRGIRPRPWARPTRPHRRGAAWTDAHRLRQRRAEAKISAGHRPRGDAVVPGIF